MLPNRRRGPLGDDFLHRHRRLAHRPALARRVAIGQPLAVPHVEHKASNFQFSQCVHLQFSLQEVAQGLVGCLAVVSLVTEKPLVTLHI